MEKWLYSAYGSFTLKIELQTSEMQKIILKVRDEKMANTYFTNRFSVFSGRKTLYVRMPVSGYTSIIEIYNAKNGNIADDNSFKVLSITQIPLVRKMDVVDFSNPLIKEYIKFCTRFCFNAGVMAPGTYYSSSRRFSIIYSEQIISSQTGQPLGTPARVNKSTGQQEVARSKFLSMTVPMRMAIMYHEFSHFYINDNINDETEADLNALRIYLGLGYPRIEACEAFLDTFIKSSQGPRPLTPEQMAANSERYNIIHQFIQDFENNKILIKD